MHTLCKSLPYLSGEVRIQQSFQFFFILIGWGRVFRGVGYSSPSEALIKNRLRTARLWTDEFYQLAKYFISEDPIDDIGDFDHVR